MLITFKIMTPIEQARKMLEEHDYTVDNYSNSIPERHAFYLKHEVLIDTCTEIIRVCERLNPYEIPFWDNVRSYLREQIN